MKEVTVLTIICVLIALMIYNTMCAAEIQLIAQRISVTQCFDNSGKWYTKEANK